MLEEEGRGGGRVLYVVTQICTNHSSYWSSYNKAVYFMLVYIAVKKVQPPERRQSNGKETGIGHPQFFFYLFFFSVCLH